MKGGDVLQDFLETLDVDVTASLFKDILSVPRERVNDSLNAKSLVLLDTYTRLNLPSDIKQKLINHAMGLKSDIKVSNLCPPEILDKVLNENFDDYRYIAKEYLRRKSGQLFFDDIKVEYKPKLLEKHIKAWLVEETISALRKM